MKDKNKIISIISNVSINEIINLQLPFLPFYIFKSESKKRKDKKVKRKVKKKIKKECTLDIEDLIALYLIFQFHSKF